MKTSFPFQPDKHADNLFESISTIWKTAREYSSRSINAAHSCACWFSGRQIVEYEQHGARKGAYGAGVLKSISERLSKQYGIGFSVSGLQYMRAFYREYPEYLSIQHAVRVKSNIETSSKKQHAVHVKSGDIKDVIMDFSAILHAPSEISDALPRNSNSDSSRKNTAWKPGIFNPNLSWTHYRQLIKVKRIEARNFYEIESIKNGWSARQLERQIDSLLFERLLKSRDKKGVLALANKGQEISKPIDIIKDPIVLEFLDLPESHRLNETRLETALISKLKDFLLELGNGFAYVGRQKRLTLEGDHFYPDLVFYHIKLKCYSRIA